MPAQNVARTPESLRMLTGIRADTFGHGGDGRGAPNRFQFAFVSPPVGLSSASEPVRWPHAFFNISLMATVISGIRRDWSFVATDLTSEAKMCLDERAQTSDRAQPQENRSPYRFLFVTSICSAARHRGRRAKTSSMVPNIRTNTVAKRL
jgi:hypothetical protein